MLPLPPIHPHDHHHDEHQYDFSHHDHQDEHPVEHALFHHFAEPLHSLPPTPVDFVPESSVPPSPSPQQEDDSTDADPAMPRQEREGQGKNVAQQRRPSFIGGQRLKNERSRNNGRQDAKGRDRRPENQIIEPSDSVDECPPDLMPLWQVDEDHDSVILLP